MNFPPDARLYPESEDMFRTPYQRDRDRIIHSRAFRRLKHKTQVFVAPQDDHYRTRLTHTIEVAQIARTLAVIFKCDESLAEALALAHDLGHPPFGHAGEDALDGKLKEYGHENGFDHNIQTLRVLTCLEKRSPHYHGLNLTQAVIAGTLKHSFPLPSITDYEKNLALKYHIHLEASPMIEAQIAAIADDIAYNHHDMDDGLRAGIFTLDMMAKHLPFTAEYLQEIRAMTEDNSIIIHMLVGKLINATVTDLVETSQASHRANKAKIIDFSKEMQDKQQMQKEFLFHHMYRHAHVVQKNTDGQKMLNDLFDSFVKKPEKLPLEWQKMVQSSSQTLNLRVVADYIAGMSDGFATQLWREMIEVD